MTHLGLDPLRTRVVSLNHEIFGAGVPMASQGSTSALPNSVSVSRLICFVSTGLSTMHKIMKFYEKVET